MKALVLYADEPDPERYAAHVELCRKVEGGTFRHGPVFGSPTRSAYRYYAEWEFPDRETFDRAAATPEFAATGKDAVEMGVRFEVLFVDA
ncbi:MAG: hypothetical protein JO186_07925 [Actinobacteria bacterium]|nr:hypothetical protein [Actinomycetota bacterium]MBV8396374.1 hypothetical protein [Actinomycetota bacterium]MBV8599557.1 hypothetical protein [Actinomycetota bacterium]